MNFAIYFASKFAPKCFNTIRASRKVGVQEVGVFLNRKCIVYENDSLGNMVLENHGCTIEISDV